MSATRLGDEAREDEQSEIQETRAVTRFSPEEEASLLKESNTQKAAANSLFNSSRFSEAVGEYDKALATCPNYLDYEIAVLKSNIAACHVKLEDWKAAVESATASLDALQRLEPKPKSKSKDVETRPEVLDKNEKTGDDAVIELDEDEDDAEALSRLQLSDERKAGVQRIRAKALLRRAKAKTSLGGWSNLTGAEEDYRILAGMASTLPSQDKKIVDHALRTLPPKINAAKDQEMAEMMGKLKDLGNGILKPFGLSTDMFKFTQDPKTGGYSMNFDGGDSSDKGKKRAE